MLCHMNYTKTTIRVPVTIMRQLKSEALRSGKTMGQLVVEGLRAVLAPPKKPPRKLPPLPVFHGGGLLVDVSNREALYDILDGRR